MFKVIDTNLNHLVTSFVKDPENPDLNLKLALHYKSLGQTASAVSYFIRTAERTNDKTLMYSCLLAASSCFDSQGCRSKSVKGLLQSAITLLPKRPEAYFFLSKFYETSGEYHDSYLIASIGEQTAEKNPPELPIYVGYPGFYGIIFEKAVSSWHCGLCDESCNLFYHLKDTYDMDNNHTNAVNDNIQRLFPERRNDVSEKKEFYEYSTALKKTSWIVDNFYETPDDVRKFALEQDFVEGGFGRGFIGRRTEKQFLFPGLKERFEGIIGERITKWEDHGMNGRFQIAWSGEPLVYHCDQQRWGGMLYLTPEAPFQCGTTMYAHKKTRARTYHEPGWDESWRDVPGDPHLDGTPFEPVDVLGNVYNRLVIFDASCIHSASEYFGTVSENARLWQMFFFDT